jgi:hypothetical protein
MLQTKPRARTSNMAFGLEIFIIHACGDVRFDAILAPCHNGRSWPVPAGSVFPAVKANR